MWNVRFQVEQPTEKLAKASLPLISGSRFTKYLGEIKKNGLVFQPITMTPTIFKTKPKELPNSKTKDSNQTSVNNKNTPWHNELTSRQVKELPENNLRQLSLTWTKSIRRWKNVTILIMIIEKVAYKKKISKPRYEIWKEQTFIT